MPSIGVVVLFFAALGAGFFNIALALVLLAIPPILAQRLHRRARGGSRGGRRRPRHGPDRRQIVRKVELPLALPLVFGGVKTSTVNVIATATLGPAAGVVTLGDPIINPSSYGDAGRLGAAIVVAALAIAAEVGLSAVQRRLTPEGLKLSERRRPARCSPFQEEDRTHIMSRRRFIPRSQPCSPSRSASPPAAATTTAGGRRRDRGDDHERREPTAIKHNDANAKTTLTVGSKNFTEQKVLGEIYAQAFQAAGYSVKKALNLGDEKTALKAVKTGQISGYPEYTGTALLSFLEGPGQGHPERRERGLRAGQGGPGQAGHRCLPADAVHLVQRGRPAEEEADELGVKKISDLKSKAASSPSTGRRSAARAWTACSASRRSTA